jgi:hypothetical protein
MTGGGEEAADSGIIVERQRVSVILPGVSLDKHGIFRRLLALGALRLSRRNPSPGDGAHAAWRDELGRMRGGDE